MDSASAFEIGDAETTPDSLTLTASSSNTSLIPDSNLHLGGSGSNRTIMVVPVAGGTGSATLTLSATDGIATTTRTFDVDVLASMVFTDSTLTPRASSVRAVHISELRARVDGVRAGVGLGAAAYGDPSLIVGTTVIGAQHLVGLRTALAEAYVAAGVSPPSYTDPGLAAGDVVKAVHITQLRSAVTALENR